MDNLAVELLLALGLFTAALGCLFIRHLARAVGLFGLFALLMTLAWLWIGAPWLALVEGLLGVGLTVASLLHALGLGSLSGLVSAFKQVGSHAHDERPALLSHGISRLLLALAWAVMMAAAMRYVVPEMAYSPMQHPLIVAAIGLAALSMGTFSLHHHLLRRLMAFNLLGSSVFLLFAGVAGTIDGAQAMIGVGLLVSAVGSLLGAVLIRRLYRLEADDKVGGDAREAASSSRSPPSVFRR